MRRATAGARHLLALALLAPWVAGANDAPWFRIRPPGEDFFVSVPRQLSRQDGEARASGGPSAVLYTSAHGFETYVVMRTDYSAEFLRSVEVHTLLDAAQSRLLSDFRGRLLEQRDRPFEGRPGREIEFEYRDGKSFAVAHALLWKERLFTVLAITSRTDRSQTNIRRFLDSFAIRER